MSTIHVSELPDQFGFTVSSLHIGRTLQAIVHDSGFITINMGAVQLTMSPGNWSFVQEIIGDALKSLADVPAAVVKA